MATGTPQRLGLGRELRIKQSRDFARLRHSPSRLGVITSGKIGNAVVRSRSRRLLREVFRLHQHELAQPVDLVLVARQSLRTKDFGEVEKDFLTTLRKAGLLK